MRAETDAKLTTIKEDILLPLTVLRSRFAALNSKLIHTQYHLVHASSFYSHLQLVHYEAPLVNENLSNKSLTQAYIVEYCKADK